MFKQSEKQLIPDYSCLIAMMPGKKHSDAEFIQYLRPDGKGPSSKTCPR
jgi:hypothetical protein